MAKSTPTREEIVVNLVSESLTKRDCPSFPFVCVSSIPRVLVCDGGDGGGGK